eukprot:5645226-Amphidinium_carterae.2
MLPDSRMMLPVMLLPTHLSRQYRSQTWKKALKPKCSWVCSHAQSHCSNLGLLGRADAGFPRSCQKLQKFTGALATIRTNL